MNEMRMTARKSGGGVIGQLVRGDSGTALVRIVVPRMSNGVDLGELAWSICIVNASGETDVVVPIGTAADDAAIVMEWKPDGIATAEEGLTSVHVEGVADGALVWSSAPCQLRIGSRAETRPSEEEEAQLSGLQELIVYVNGQLNGVIAAGREADASAERADQSAATANASAGRADQAAATADAAAGRADQAAATADAAAGRADQSAATADAAADAANAAAAAPEAAANRAETAAALAGKYAEGLAAPEAEAQTLEAGSQATAEYEKGEGGSVTLKLGIPRGEDGRSGVHIGPEEPEDPTVNVWVSTEDGVNKNPAILYEEQALTEEQQAQARKNIDAAKAFSAGEGLVMNGDVLGVRQVEYALIEKIPIGYEFLEEQPEDWAENWALYYWVDSVKRIRPVGDSLTTQPAWRKDTYLRYTGEVVNRITRTQEPDGTPYNFTDIIVFGHMTPDVNAQGLLDIKAYNNSDKIISAGLANIPLGVADQKYNHHIAFHVRKMPNGIYDSYISSGAQGSPADVFKPTPGNHESYISSAASVGNIAKLDTFIYPNDTLNFVEGTYIEIWGVRANA